MPGKQAKIVTPPILKRMLRHASRSSFPARDRAMILLSVKAGLRACEIAGLDWSMVLYKARLGLISGLRDAYRWLDELITEPRHTIETIAARECKTERSIRMTLSLAFLAPGIVEAGIEGKLPRGFGVTRLTDLPMAWSEQWKTIGIAQPN